MMSFTTHFVHALADVGDYGAPGTGGPSGPAYTLGGKAPDPQPILTVRAVHTRVGGHLGHDDTQH